MFTALYLDKKDKQFSASVTQLADKDLPVDGDVLIDVRYSTLNYKDALAITNTQPVIRHWPMVPGIDLAGIVISSQHPHFVKNDPVILNGWGAGETHWGGLTQKSKVNGDWLIHLPDGLTLKRAMAIGTAGYTAMLCILALEKHGVRPEDGEILVTGASGGVGSIAIALLAHLGYCIVASTGKAQTTAYLQSLGATTIIPRSSLSTPNQPLQKERYSAVIDTIGSYTLVNACAQVKAGGAIAACGLAQGADFPGTVFPFILRGITLYGIHSVTVPTPLRIAAWARLAQDLDMETLDMMTTEIALAETLDTAAQLIAGKMTGRIVVDVNR